MFAAAIAPIFVRAMTQLYLKMGRDKPIRHGHPWVFSGAVQRITGDATPGDLCDIYSAEHQFLARGYYNPHSQIVARTFASRDVEVDAGFFTERLRTALALRETLVGPETTAYRVVNTEGDLLPGLIVDRYGDFAVVQCQTLGMDARRDLIAEALKKVLSAKGVYERSDVYTRREEGLDLRTGVMLDEAPPASVEVTEGGVRFRVNIRRGQKTGLFLDQRENRLFARSLARGLRVLDLCCYTGGFSAHALAGGAERVVAVDTSETVLTLARENVIQNFGESAPFEAIRGDAFKVLRELDESFDLIVADPPAFARSKDMTQRAARGYKDLNLWAIRRLTPGGMLLTFSCSNFVDLKLFGQIVFAASADARRPVQILGRLGAGHDHPVNIAHPEGNYLKGLWLRAAE